MDDHGGCQMVMEMDRNTMEMDQVLSTLPLTLLISSYNVRPKDGHA